MQTVCHTRTLRKYSSAACQCIAIDLLNHLFIVIILYNYFVRDKMLNFVLTIFYIPLWSIVIYHWIVIDLLYLYTVVTFSRSQHFENRKSRCRYPQSVNNYDLYGYKYIKFKVYSP